jgi:hypothetical protein
MGAGTDPGVLLPVEIDAYGATKIWDDQGLKSNAILMAMVHINHGRLTGQIDGQVYRFLREVAAFWECYLIKTPLPGGEHVYNDMNDCPYEICSADHYGSVDGKPVFYESVNNPTNCKKRQPFCFWLTWRVCTYVCMLYVMYV